MKSYKVILLNAENGYKLYNKTDNIICSAIQLPIDADLSVWEEITEERAIEYEEAHKPIAPEPPRAGDIHLQIVKV